MTRRNMIIALVLGVLAICIFMPIVFAPSQADLLTMRENREFVDNQIRVQTALADPLNIWTISDPDTVNGVVCARVRHANGATGWVLIEDCRWTGQVSGKVHLTNLFLLHPSQMSHGAWMRPLTDGDRR